MFPNKSHLFFYANLAIAESSDKNEGFTFAKKVSKSKLELGNK